MNILSIRRVRVTAGSMQFGRLYCDSASETRVRCRGVLCSSSGTPQVIECFQGLTALFQNFCVFAKYEGFVRA